MCEPSRTMGPLPTLLVQISSMLGDMFTKDAACEILMSTPPLLHDPCLRCDTSAVLRLMPLRIEFLFLPCSNEELAEMPQLQKKYERAFSMHFCNMAALVAGFHEARLCTINGAVAHMSPPPPV